MPDDIAVPTDRKAEQDRVHEVEEVVVVGERIRRLEENRGGWFSRTVGGIWRGLGYGITHDAIDKGVPWLAGAAVDLTVGTVESVGGLFTGRRVAPWNRLTGHPERSFASRWEAAGDRAEPISTLFGFGDVEMRRSRREGAGMFDLEITIDERNERGEIRPREQLERSYVPATGWETGGVITGNIASPDNIAAAAAAIPSGGSSLFAKLGLKGLGSTTLRNAFRTAGFGYNSMDMGAGGTMITTQFLMPVEISNMNADRLFRYFAGDDLDSVRGRQNLQGLLNDIIAPSIDFEVSRDSTFDKALPLNGDLNAPPKGGDAGDNGYYRLAYIAQSTRPETSDAQIGTVNPVFEMNTAKAFVDLSRRFIANPDMHFSESDMALATFGLGRAGALPLDQVGGADYQKVLRGSMAEYVEAAYGNDMARASADSARLGDELAAFNRRVEDAEFTRVRDSSRYPGVGPK